MLSIYMCLSTLSDLCPKFSLVGNLGYKWCYEPVSLPDFNDLLLFWHLLGKNGYDFNRDLKHGFRHNCKFESAHATSISRVFERNFCQCHWIAIRYECNFEGLLQRLDTKGKRCFQKFPISTYLLSVLPPRQVIVLGQAKALFWVCCISD